MKYFILIIIFSFWNISYGQIANTTGKSLSDADFAKAKQLYLDMTNSDTYIRMKTSTKLMMRKLGSVNDLDFYKTDESFSTWITANLASTKFKTAEEAIRLRKTCVALEEKLVKENAEVYELITSASRQQLKEILLPERWSAMDNK